MIYFINPGINLSSFFACRIGGIFFRSGGCLPLIFLIIGTPLGDGLALNSARSRQMDQVAGMMRLAHRAVRRLVEIGLKGK